MAAPPAAAAAATGLTPASVYRRLLKMYIRKFAPHYKFIVHAVRQTKFEFYANKDVAAEEVPVLLQRAQEIGTGIEHGLIPVVKNGRGELVGKVNREMFNAGGGVVEPLSLQDSLLRLRPQISDEEFARAKQMLQQMGRWEERGDVVASIKKKTKARCSDPDEPADGHPVPKEA